MNKTEKNYKLYDLRILFKNRVTFWSILFLTPIIGFLMPKDLYDLLNRGNISGILPSFWLIFVSIILILINLVIIRIILLTKYAVKRQSNLAGPIIYLVIAVLAFAGIWLRLYLEYIIPSASALLSAGTITSSTATPPLPFSLWPAVISVTITLSLYSTVFGLVSEPYSKVDYSAFHSSLERFFVKVRELRDEKGSQPGVTIEAKYATDIKKVIDDTIKHLQTEVDKEKDYYAEFVNTIIFPPLRKMDEFLSMRTVEDDPKLILQLCRNDNKTTPSWIKENGFLKSFGILLSLRERSQL